MIVSDNENKKVKIHKQTDSDLCATSLKSDENYEKNIRPLTFDDYIGQTSIKETLNISIEACKKRG